MTKKETGTVVSAAVLEGFGRYEILDSGVVRYRSTGKLCPDYDDGKNGYRKIKLYPDNSKVRKSFWISRLVYEAFNGPIPPEMEIDHLDGNRLNNSLNNLLLVTHKQNQILKKQRDSKFLFNRPAKTTLGQKGSVSFLGEKR